MNIKPPVSEKERKFLAKWRERRRSGAHLVRYVAIHGVGWGLFTAVGSYLFKIRFDLDQFVVYDFWVAVMASILVGTLFGYAYYRAQDKRFKQVYPDDSQ